MLFRSLTGCGGQTAARYPGYPTTWALLSAPPAKQIALRDASAALGAPVVLPNTALVTPSDASQVWEQCHISVNDRCTAMAVWVKFPAQGVTVRYTPGAYGDPLRMYQGVAQSDGDRAKVVRLSSVPVLMIPEVPKHPVSTATWIEFALNGITISVEGHYADPSPLEAVAQSIIDQSG